jgi:hypothetical protein
VVTAKQVDHPVGIGAISHQITQAVDPADLPSLQVTENCLRSEAVSMHVREESKSLHRSLRLSALLIDCRFGRCYGLVARIAAEST